MREPEFPNRKEPRYPTDLEKAMGGNMRAMLRLMTDDPKTFKKRFAQFMKAFKKKNKLED